MDDDFHVTLPANHANCEQHIRTAPSCSLRVPLHHDACRRKAVEEDPALKALLARLTPFYVDPGLVLVEQGQPSDAAYFIAEGDILIRAETAYGRVPLATLPAPRLVGEIGVLAGIARTASMEAANRLKVYRIEKADLVALGRQAPELLLTIMGQIGRQMTAVNQTIALYTNALTALEREAFDPRILEDLANPPPQLAEFAETFRRFAAEIEDKRRTATEMASAALIQTSLLPSAALDAALKVDLSARIRAARRVGGDFYDFFALDDHRVVLVIGDVCGKGVPASIFMAVVVTVLRTAARDQADVAAMLRWANSVLCRDNASSMFATAFFGILNTRTGVLEYGNCGHSGPVVMRAGAAPQALAATGLPLAMFDDRSAAVATLTLEPDDLLVLVTDGVTEAEDLAAAQFGDDRLAETVAAVHDQPAPHIVDTIFDAVDRFAAGAEQFDDITVLVAKRTP
jgi:serine phosphatase RsbU (regulator of sigma subunit)